MEVSIIQEIVIIFALSIGVLLGCHRLKLPTVVGFLVTGVLCGPHGLGFVSGLQNVQVLATIGIVLLLFTVGMEFSLNSIIRYKYFFFGGGAFQVFSTLALTMVIARYGLERAWGEATFWGFLISLSSTAIVLRLLEDRAESDSPHGKLTVGILIFQDLIAVPMMLMVPVLAGTSDGFHVQAVYNFLMAIGVVVLMGVLAYYAIPYLLYYVTRTRSRELFLLCILTICFAVAWITSSIGLSLSLGAFLAGLVISTSEYSDEAVGDVIPFQEIFTSFFFVSMGMLLDLSFVFEQPLLIFAITLLVIVLKSVIGVAAGVVLGMPLRSAILAGVALSQVGEFSFVLARSGTDLKLISGFNYQLFLAVSLLTMGLTPLMIYLSNYLVTWFEKLPWPHRFTTGLHYSHDIATHKQLEGHIIIVGFGLRGKHLARAAKETGLTYLILELNPETVKSERKREPIRFGDPSHPSVLLHAGVKKAMALAVVINDPIATLQIVRIGRSLNPSLYIITRTRYFTEVQNLFKAGADDVIPDEFGSSLEIFTRVLQKAQVLPATLMRCINQLRMEGYEILKLQNPATEAPGFLDIDPSAAKIETLHVQEGSPLVGKTVLDSGLKKNHGLTVLLIKRQHQTITSVEADTVIEIDDAIMVIGSPQSVEQAKNVF